MKADTKEVREIRRTLRDIAKEYLDDHDDLSPTEKQKLFQDLQHEHTRLAKAKLPKIKEEE